MEISGLNHQSRSFIQLINVIVGILIFECQTFDRKGAGLNLTRGVVLYP